MTTRPSLIHAAGGALIASLALAQPAPAQQQGAAPGPARGTTSGPAAGTPVVPSTAAQKDNPAAGSGQPGAAAAQQGAAGVGVPGAAAKPGSEGGSSPAPGSGKRP